MGTVRDANDNCRVSVEVVSQVASAKGCHPLELPPLYETADPDALEAFVTSLGLAGAKGFQTIEFQYANAQVSVSPDGEVAVWYSE